LAYLLEKFPMGDKEVKWISYSNLCKKITKVGSGILTAKDWRPLVKGYLSYASNVPANGSVKLVHGLYLILHERMLE
jgi:hypothetical protein